MNLLELKQKVDAAIESAKEYGDNPEQITASIQIDTMAGKSLWSTDIELLYDNDCQASGCVMLGMIDESQ